MEAVYSFDRVEGDLAVLVDDGGASLSLPLAALPSGAHPGAVMRRVGETFVLLPEETEARRQRALELQRRLRRR